MFVNKMGKHHLDYGQNCQDYGTVKGRMKLVCDGCSGGAHTEVGAKAFVHLMEQGYGIEEAFGQLFGLFGQTPEDVRDYLCFTILMVQEEAEGFRVSYCGDGYVLLEDPEGAVTFLELGGGEYPEYYAYNYTDRSRLWHYRDGVQIKEHVFSKKQYQRAGAATDGLRYVLRDECLRAEFTEVLCSDREAGMKRWINRHQDALKDDLTIVW